MKNYIVHTPEYKDGKPVNLGDYPKCYEVKFSFIPPKPVDDRWKHWRDNRTAFVIAHSLPEAFAIIAAEFPNDPQIHQIILRSTSNLMIFSGDVLSGLQKPQDQIP
jgi:hypothetical protein